MGSGVSANSVSADGSRNPLTWDAFIREILKNRADRLVNQIPILNSLLSEKNYLLACEIIINVIGDRDFGELAADEFRRPGFKPGEVHNLIYSLDSKIVITPNIDKIYEQCAYTNSHGTVVIKKYYEEIAPFLRQSDYLVIKAHGCVDDPQNIVFTHEQYNHARYRFASFYRILDSLLLTHTFIFVGCGLTDPDIQLTLESSNFSFPNCRPHYFVTSHGSVDDEVSNSLLRNRNIEILTYDNTDGSHKELLIDIRALLPLVESKRQEISSNATW